MLRQLFLLICFLTYGFATNTREVHSSFSSPIGTVLISTIDGHLRALDTIDGSVKWTLQEEPVLRAPSVVKRGFTFLPNPQDGSLYVLKEGSLKKLPFTIPQLVHASPCRGNDGVLYAGSKKDVWFGIDPVTGVKVETLSSATTERVCPANQQHAVFLGRTEYRVSMFDTQNRAKTWNATFTDYSAHLLPVDSSYPLRHYVSSSSGSILAVDIDSGQIVWERDLKQPIVAMYLLQDDGLHKLPFTIMGKETMENLVKSAYSTDSWGSVSPGPSSSSSSSFTTSTQNSLFPTLYVGETAFGLYAISAFVDQHTITYAPKYLGPPLLEGPSPIAISAADRNQFVPPKRPIVNIDNIPSITHKTTDGEFLILGYHEPPAMHLGSIIPARFPHAPTFPPIAFKPNDDDVKKLPAASLPDHSSLSSMVYEIYVSHPKTVYGAVTVLVVLVVTIIWTCGKQSGVASIVGGEARSAQTSRVSNSGKQWIFSKNDELPDGWLNVGKVLYNPQDVLGRGCEGTVVYRGKFDGREVAVKRVVTEFVRLVDREADLLRESDTHPHVIRYFCMESDSQFRYLALELCVASLYDYVEKKAVREQVDISKMEILQQATDGLAHLHDMNIVHRDMKPQNVLISVSGQRGRVRAVISDFGLCKRIQPGRHSLSRRSGTAGTDGWIAPEALKSESTSHPVDIFSLGCIFYYVLSEGRHPFGGNFHRQANILQGQYNLKDIKEGGNVDVVIQLIEMMIQQEPRDRPSARAALLHPFFWNSERRLQFFGDVSDRIEKEEEGSPVVRRLERNARAVVAGGWRKAICQLLADDLRRFRTYRSHSVRDLLRAMRNKKHHYRELSREVRDSLGHIPHEFLLYWTSRFPMLLMHVYESMEWCAAEPVFQGYYPDEVRSRMSGLVAEEEELRREMAENRESSQWVRGQTVVMTTATAGSTPEKGPVAAVTTILAEQTTTTTPVMERRNNKKQPAVIPPSIERKIPPQVEDLTLPPGIEVPPEILAKMNLK